MTAVARTVIIPGNHFHSRVSERLAEIGAYGLLLNQDYTWAYYPAQIAWGESGTPAHTCVTFVDSKWATYFGLKWA